MPYTLKLGQFLIEDILNPKPEQMDLHAIEERLRVMRRFSNDPKALTVHQHRVLVTTLAQRCGYHGGEVQEWCWHHDDHEAIIGDIPGPLKGLISDYTDILRHVETGLDRAICLARRIAFPTDDTRRRVHIFDKAAEAIEWLWVLNQPPQRWNAAIPVDEHTARELLDHALKAA